MIYPIYSIKDVKVGFISPIVEQNEGTAVRNFAYAINNGGIMNYSPKDFDIYKIGEFDSESGKIDGIIPEFVCSGISVFGEKT